MVNIPILNIQSNHRKTRKTATEVLPLRFVCGAAGYEI